MKCKITISLLMHGNDVMFFDFPKQETLKIKICFIHTKNTTQTVSFDGSYVNDEVSPTEFLQL
jgi:hypothetical protein